MKLKKIAAWLLLTACTFSCACTPKDKGNKGPTANGVVNESDTYDSYVEGTLHDVNVDFNAAVSNFVTNGQTDYQVVISDAASGKASGLITEHVYKATGANLSVLDSIPEASKVDENTQYIFVGCEELYEEVCEEMPTYEKIGDSGYQVITYGKNVFINAYSLNGYQMGAIAFLREVIGYEMFAADCVLYEIDGKKMPKMDIVERPDFDYRQCSNGLSSTEVFGMGYTINDPIINTGESWVHNWYDFVSLEEADENPDWASNDSTRWQGCWTSRGNKDSYAKLVDHIAGKIIKYLKQFPDRNSMMIGQHDIGGNTPNVQNCKCTACQASYDYYGTMAGAWLSLCNRASIRVDEYLHTQEAIDFFGGVKDWNLLELVYHTSVNPPVEKDDKGNYVLTEDGVGIPKVEKWFDNEGNMWDWEEAWTAEDGSSIEAPVIKAWSDTHERLYTAPNVHFMYAASASDWTHSYYESQNSSWKSIVDGWGGVGGNFFIWAYALNSEGLLYPYNSFDTEFESTRYFKKLGSKYIFWQCQYENPNNSGFTKLRVYLNSKVEFDVNLDYQTLVDRFFKNYYGPAADIMQLYFEQVQAQCRWMEEVNAINGGIHNSKLLYKENWPEGLMHTWIDMMNSAKDLIDEEYAMTNPKLAETYKKHVTIEEQFPTYVLCTTYATSYQALELKKLRKDFLDTFYALGNAAYAEGRKMTLISDGWDLD